MCIRDRRCDGLRTERPVLTVQQAERHPVGALAAQALAVDVQAEFSLLSGRLTKIQTHRADAETQRAFRQHAPAA